MNAVVFIDFVPAPVLQGRMIELAEAAVREDKARGGERDPQTLWSLMKEKALETGVQGVPNIGRAQHRARRFFWILVVFGGMGEYCSHCHPL